ncbi:hypothetical protein AOQ84DRAFT_272746, partial [Glonium stellatum]
PQLSCELCRERKVRCDKLSPCTNCSKTGVACIPVHRKRLPRGRHVHNPSFDNDLRDRIERLEVLITNLDPTGAVPTSSSMPESEQVRIPVDASPCTAIMPSPMSASPLTPTQPKRTKEITAGRCMAKNFWGNLAEEIHGLRDIVDQPSDDDEDHAETPHDGQQSRHSISSSIVGVGSSYAGAMRSFVSGFLAFRPVPAICRQLFQIYLRQVHPIIKALHGPSLSRFMLDGKPYLGYKEGHFAVEALSSAVCYSAINSMTEEQCQSMFHASRSAVSADHRVACEGALERAGLITTRDITTLQAFVLYLIATRTQDQSRGVWTLVPVAVRIARALFLHVDGHTPHETFFEKQMRRRLWYTICLLDLQTSFDQASEPVITPDSLHPSMPKNVNDSEFEPEFNGDLPDREDLTDMTFSLVTYNAQASGKVLNFIPASGVAKSSMGVTYNWDARQRYVENFEQTVMKLLRHCDPSGGSYAWFAFHGSEAMVAAMKLAALRPLYRAGSGAPPRVQGSSHLLELSAIVLEKVYLIRTDLRGEAFRWYIVLQWHALAIAIAECYACNDAALVKRLWPLIETSFKHHSDSMIEYRRGMLWRPMEKLMGRTRSKVAALFVPGSQP